MICALRVSSAANILRGFGNTQNTSTSENNHSKPQTEAGQVFPGASERAPYRARGAQPLHRLKPEASRSIATSKEPEQ